MKGERVQAFINTKGKRDKEIELWSIWLEEEQKQSIKSCKLCELNSKKIKEVLKSEQNSVALCLRVIK